MMLSPSGSSIAANENDNLGFSTRLWRESKGKKTFSIFTPFLLSMAANNLPPQSYQHYLTQDEYYLKAYADVCQICIDNTDDNEIREMFQEMKPSAYEAIEQRALVLKRIGMERRGEDPICPTTQNYIDFLKGTAEGTVEELKNLSIEKSKLPNFSLCAMTPCSKLYYVAGTELKDAMVVPNKYEEWIEYNAREKYKVRVAKIESLLDRISKEMTTDERNAAEKLYKHGMKHELEFFLSNPLNRDKVVVPLWEKLKSINGKLKFSVYGNAILAGDTYVTSALFEDNLFQIVLKYACDFSLNQKGGILTCETLETAVKSMEDIKEKVTAATGQQVILQRYGIDFFSKVLEKTAEFISINVNPSGGWSEGTNFQANELNKDNDKVLTAYIGSSVDEWTYLRKADIGIVIEQNEDLRRKGSEDGVSFIPLFKGLVTYQSHFDGTLFPWKKPNPPVLYTISSWVEVDAFILGSSEYALDC